MSAINSAWGPVTPSTQERVVAGRVGEDEAEEPPPPPSTAIGRRPSPPPLPPVGGCNPDSALADIAAASFSFCRLLCRLREDLEVPSPGGTGGAAGEVAAAASTCCCRCFREALEVPVLHFASISVFAASSGNLKTETAALDRASAERSMRAADTRPADAASEAALCEASEAARAASRTAAKRCAGGTCAIGVSTRHESQRTFS